MYDFHFGPPDKIEAEKDRYLLFIKRMMPRWVNSIPDSEYLALHELATRFADHPRPVFVETGIGASTLALLDIVLRTGGVLYSWDINGAKGAFLRSVINDTLVPHYGRPLHQHWRFVAYASTAPLIGIQVLKELNERVDLAFLDSEHTLNNLLAETRLVAPRLNAGSLFVIDDANYDYVHTNIAYINMQRQKLGLPPAPEPPDNRGATFRDAARACLVDAGLTLSDVPTSYADAYDKDIFFAYFAADRAAMAEKGMEKMEALGDRIAAWRIDGGAAG